MHQFRLFNYCIQSVGNSRDNFDLGFLRNHVLSPLLVICGLLQVSPFIHFARLGLGFKGIVSSKAVGILSRL